MRRVGKNNFMREWCATNDALHRLSLMQHGTVLRSALALSYVDTRVLAFAPTILSPHFWRRCALLLGHLTPILLAASHTLLTSSPLGIGWGSLSQNQASEKSVRSFLICIRRPRVAEGAGWVGWVAELRGFVCVGVCVFKARSIFRCQP